MTHNASTTEFGTTHWPKHVFATFRASSRLDQAGALLILFACIPNRVFVHIRYGIDPSWQYALATAVEKGYRFGTEWVFTYGPLGFLNFSWPVEGWILPVLLYKATLFALLSALGIAFLWRQKRVTDKLWCVLTFVVIGRLYYFDVSLYFLILFLTGLCWNSLRPRPWLLFALTVFAALNFFIKLNTAFVGILLWLLHTGWLLFSGRQRPAIIAGQWLLFVLLLGLLAWITNTSLAAYTTNGWEIIRHYSDAMFFVADGQPWLPRIGWIILGMVSLALAVLVYRQRKNPLMLMSLAGYGLVLFLAYKQGFVRSGGTHSLLFFAAVLLLILSGSLFMAKATVSPAWSRGRWAVLGLCLLANLLIGRYGFPNRPLKDLYAAESFSVVSMGAAILNKVGDQSIDLLPYNSMHLYGNRLNYQPRPDPQGYQTYSAGLDSLNADYFTGSRAPAFVLIKNGSIDRRHPAWDEYRTKLAIRRGYTVVDSCRLPDYPLSEQPDMYWLMQRRAGASVPEHFAAGPTVAQPISQPIDCSAWGEDDLVQVEIDYNGWGKLRYFFFQPGQLNCVLAYADGSSDTFPAIRPQMAAGIPAGKRLETEQQFLGFLTQRPAAPQDRIRMLQLVGDYHYFKKEIRVRRLMPQS